MKILPIHSSNYNINNNKPIQNKDIKNISTPIHANQLTGIPKSYISFGGGDSLNLYKTLSLLENKKERTNEEQIPYIVKIEILNELAKRNPNNKTLIDIHKTVFQKLTTAKDLNEIKSPAYVLIFSQSILW